MDVKSALDSSCLPEWLFFVFIDQKQFRLQIHYINKIIKEFWNKADILIHKTLNY